ncbi:MAG: serine/threonine-protein kinase [Planctomycetaceae bacterium]
MARLPDTLGPLMLSQQLGVGRQCQVWSAKDTVAGRQVAVKILQASFADDRVERRQLEHEMRVGREFDHPGVIRVDRLAIYEGFPCLVMELFPHPNLRRLVTARQHRLHARLPTILVGIAEALAHMHARGWVHRDVKPANVLANRAAEVKVIDFAIAAKPPGALGRLVWRRKQPQGTPSYMAPEQIRGQAPDPRSDVYSLGCMAFELLGGHTPFTGSNTHELLTRHLYTAAPGVEPSNSNVTAAASKLIRQMMAKKPAERPTAADVARQIRQIRLFERDPAPPDDEPGDGG